MSEESSSEDRTEEPTSQRLQKAREDGDAARSIEVPAAAVVIAAAAFYPLTNMLMADNPAGISTMAGLRGICRGLPRFW